MNIFRTRFFLVDGKRLFLNKRRKFDGKEDRGLGEESGHCVGGTKPAIRYVGAQSLCFARNAAQVTARWLAFGLFSVLHSVFRAHRPTSFVILTFSLSSPSFVKQRLCMAGAVSFAGGGLA